MARLEPPDDLTEAQAAVWRCVVETKPPDWFASDSAPLLSAYCRAVCEHLAVSRIIDATNVKCLKDEKKLDRFDKLLRMQDRLARQMVTLATKMRLTQQSRYRADAAAVAAGKSGNGTKPRPWQPQVVRSGEPTGT